MADFEQDYYNLVNRVMTDGVDIKNERTGVVCRTVPNAVMTYESAPIISRKQVFVKSAFAEMVGYIRAYTNAADFRRLGTRTWDANANETISWLNNPNRKGVDDMGKVYGAVASDFGGIDLFRKVYNNLKAGVDDRGEIITFWKPDDFELGCLRPCMMMHQFTLIDRTLYLTSYQRSCDLALGIPFNMVQTWFLLELMAAITNNKVGNVTHVLNNVHIYSNQMDAMREFMDREPNPDNDPFMVIDPKCNSLQYVKEEINKIDDIVKVHNYHHSGKLVIPFTA